MSATAPTPTGGQDQSMDDILASIRRILNEDEAAAAEATEDPQTAASAPEVPAPAASSVPPAPERAAPPAAPAPIAPVLERQPPPSRSGPEPVELTSDMLVTPPAAVSPKAGRFEETQAASPPRMGMEDTSDLIGPATAAAAAASVGSLLRAVSSERSSPIYRGGPSIEDVVREEIRPVLKEWLDTHLPPLVERLVRAEIERVVNRGLT